ncbi:MAG: ABC transporter ATP-binding protein [Burkholderiales bacterium]|nr:ABC transporter ATP-binding protein [Burkholderiales bacterium]MCC7114741.1 ABC transporter ATP-binding protein [Burkholderiales bacterium]
MSKVVLKGVSKRYGDVVALRELDLEIREGEFLTLLGPSGCGKTTTLRMIAGFIEPSTGTILLGDEDVTHVRPNKRGIGMVFQDYALFPHMTIGENIAFGLVERKVDKTAVARRVRELLELVRLPQMENRFPPELSGGQQQRIAVARAVAYSPKVLLMDEPLGALDLKLREVMQGEIRQIQKKLGITTVYVTHDQTEAMHMSDRIAVMNHGVMEQIGTAEDIYKRPRTRFVADFIGQINLLDATVVDAQRGHTDLDIDGRRVRAQGCEGPASGKVTLAIRPQHLALVARGGAANGNRFDGKVAGTTFSGNLVHVEVLLDGGQKTTVEARPEDAPAAPGDSVAVEWKPETGIVLTK